MRAIRAAGRFLALAVALAGMPSSGNDAASALYAAARTQIGVTLAYDPSYVRLGFPGGDVDPARGVCSDVVIRAFRGQGIDLQLAVNRDMGKDFSAYPGKWGLTRPDRNIDHRRVPNLQVLFRRIGAGLPVSDDPGDYLAGDVVTWMLPGNLPHIGILTDARSADGVRPLAVHNIGAGTREEDVLTAFPITGHFRFGGAAIRRLTLLGAL